MLRFQSVYWATRQPEQFTQKLSRLGFNVTPSPAEPATPSIYFGPEALEILGPQQKGTALSDLPGIEDFIRGGDGIFAMGLESDDIVGDYKGILKTAPDLEKPRRSPGSSEDMPLWFGFHLPKNLTPMLRAWVMMYSPAVLKMQARQTLPYNHPNTCFGLEAVHLVTKDPEPVASQWGHLMDTPVADLHWTELAETKGRRIQAGERFFDMLSSRNEGPLNAAAHGREGVFMLTLKCEDLEGAKARAIGAGAVVTDCRSRDGFVISSDYTEGPALRMVRASWKRYLPTVNENFPLGRRTDKYRPLGGANSTTLENGFADNWKY